MIRDTDKLLHRLGEQLELRSAPPMKIVVCGGAALNVLGYINRTTRDVDVLGEFDSNEQSIERTELSEEFLESVSIIANEFDLDDDWFNTGPDDMVETGLPEGLVDRLTFREYGTRLTVGFIDRIDQIYFKLWASADQGGTGTGKNRHVQDLEDLAPKPNEIKDAARWCLKQDPSEGFRTIMDDMLRTLGFDDVAKEL